MPRMTSQASTTKTTKICNPEPITNHLCRPVCRQGLKTAKAMKAIKIIFLTGTVICCTLAIIFRTVTLPVALVYEALTAMAEASNDAAEEIMRNVKGEV